MNTSRRRRAGTILHCLLVALGAAAEPATLLDIDRIFHDEEFDINEPEFPHRCPLSEAQRIAILS